MAEARVKTTRPRRAADPDHPVAALVEVGRRAKFPPWPSPPITAGNLFDVYDLARAYAWAHSPGADPSQGERIQGFAVRAVIHYVEAAIEDLMARMGEVDA